MKIAFNHEPSFHRYSKQKYTHIIVCIELSYNNLLFSLSRLSQLQELNLDGNNNCREAFSVIGEMISLRKLSFELHVDDVYDDDDDDDDDDYDDYDEYDDIHFLDDSQRWVKRHTNKGFTISMWKYLKIHKAALPCCFIFS